jgi:hypothetical protein
MNWYNGFSPTERARRGSKKARSTAPTYILQAPCSMCGDPKPAKMFSHAEDYSTPYKWDPPYSYPLCDPCHKRLHRRFLAPGRWVSYLAFLRRGYFGREVTGDDVKSYELNGESFSWPRLTHAPRKLSSTPWWESLCMDPRSLREGVAVCR